MVQDLHLRYDSQKSLNLSIDLPLSKSIEARRLVLRAIEGLDLGDAPQTDLGDAEDIEALYEALTEISKGGSRINVRESGTAMRLVLAYLSASTTHTIELYGIGRQHERPIAPLVQALRALGGHISYINQEGYPPLRIEGSTLQAREIALDASQSSQYLSALMLIAPLIEGSGYSIDTREYGLASRPYAEMTMRQMQESGYIWQENEGLFTYTGRETKSLEGALHQERDWSAASYAYLLMSLEALNQGPTSLSLKLPGLRQASLQGDAQMLGSTYEALGIKTEEQNACLSLRFDPIANPLIQRTPPKVIHLNCAATPDLVPTLVASLVAMGLPFRIDGVQHLRIKESDRLAVLKSELDKINIHLDLGDDHIAYQGGIATAPSTAPLILNPHQDHRIAMALAPLFAYLCPQGVIVQNANCVAKSFPHYWREISKFGYKLKTIG